MVALEGDAHVSRVSASLLTRVGHPEWVAGDKDSYVRIAADLASDVIRLNAIRSALRDEYLASPLADAVALSRAMEAEYRHMWRGWCQARGAA